jgi:hypothetical protein
MSDDLHMLWYVRDEDTDHKLAVEVISESDGTLMALGETYTERPRTQGFGEARCSQYGSAVMVDGRCVDGEEDAKYS